MNLRDKLTFARALLEHHPDHETGELVYDDFGQCPAQLQDGEYEPLLEEERVRIRLWLEKKGISLTRTQVDEVIEEASKATRVHPVLADLLRVDHDGKKRLDTWLATYLGAPKTALMAMYGRGWLISAVARVFQPGCTVAGVLVLEGEQGTGKTKSILTLGSTWARSCVSGPRARRNDVLDAWIVDLNPIRERDIEKTKLFVMKTRDIWGGQPYQRQCVFATTTNTPIDPRRWLWVVPTGAIDNEALARDRSQLLAEAVEMYRQDHPWWPPRTGEEADQEMTDTERLAEIHAMLICNETTRLVPDSTDLAEPHDVGACVAEKVRALRAELADARQCAAILDQYATPEAFLR